MAAKSPNDLSDSTLTLVITSDGTQIKDYYPVISLRTVNEVNKIPYAEILIKDGSADTADFPISESTDFLPGAKIVISAGYVGPGEEQIFSGVVVKHGLRITATGDMNLVVLAKHDAVSMTFNKKEALFIDKKDSDIITAIVGEYGLTSTVSASTPLQPQLLQKMATDWDFILSRADFLGFIATFKLDALTIGKPVFSSTEVLRVALGESIISFDAELSAEKQAPELEASAWDLKTQAIIKSAATEPTLNAHGNLTAKTLSGKLSQSKLQLSSGAPMPADALTAWADGNLLRMRLSAMKGTVSFQGNASVHPGDLIELAGVGDRFNGKAFVSSVEHNIADGNWETTVKFGLDHKLISERPDFNYPAAAGQLPAIQGLQIGTVKKLSADPASEHRVQVDIFTNATVTTGVWARMSNFYATGTAGSTFLPEVGDEVVVGFMEGNPAAPVILGSLYSSKNTAPYTAADEKNSIKAITTKSQLKLTFDDEKKIVKILTPGNNSITLDDEGKAIEIKDQNGNSLKMSASGIELKSDKDIKLTATGNITLTATGKAEIKATGDAAISGANVKNTAQIAFSAKGNATAELSASGQTTVKGAMVMIN